jgi:DNA-directed RNA polymerase specialized sigma24 family protein
MAAAFPPQDMGLALHRRLCAGDDPVAPAEFARAYLDPLVAAVGRRFPGVDPHVVEQAAADALLDLVRHPDRYDPDRRKLRGYLLMAARGDLLNLLNREERHRRRRVSLDDVELTAAGGNEVMGADGLARLNDYPSLTRVRDALTEPDRRVLDLMCQGERRWEVFAAALGVANRPRVEWRRTVKRVTDRIMRRLQRAARQP